MAGTLDYLPFFLLAGTITLLIVVALGTGSLAAGGRGRRGKIVWRRRLPPPFPDPPLGRNRHEVHLGDIPDHTKRPVRRAGRPPSDPDVPVTPPKASDGGSGPR